MTNETSNAGPWGLWTEWMEKNMKSWMASAGSEKLQGDWRGMFQNWTDTWMKSLNEASPQMMQTGMKMWADQAAAWTRAVMQGYGGERPDPMELWRSAFGSWSESWAKFFSEAASSEALQTGQKLWTEQLEVWTKALAQAMDTEAFAKVLATTAQQNLTWTERFQNMVHPQVEETFRLLNLPSRHQISRTLEELADLQRAIEDASYERAATSQKVDAANERIRTLEQRLGEITERLEAILSRVEQPVSEKRLEQIASRVEAAVSQLQKAQTGPSGRPAARNAKTTEPKQTP